MKKISKIIILILAFISVCVSLVWGSNASLKVYADGNGHDHTGMVEWTSTNSLPTSGSYYLANDVTISSTCTISGTLNLCLNGHGIRFTGTNANNGSIFYIGEGKTLNLYDCGTNEHKFTIDVTTLSSSFNSIEGINCRAGLATVDDNLTEGYETFTGGYITGGIGRNTSGNYFSGGAVFIYGGTFNMYGGTLIGNTTKGTGSSPSSSGGAVAIRGGSFTMNGGAIIGNRVQGTSGDWGGAIYMGAEYVNGSYRSAYFTMNDGIIERNSAETGGAIFVGSSSGTYQGIININKGIFRDNVATNGGGAILAQFGDITIKNCEMSGNIASSGPAIYMYPTVYSSSKIASKLNISDSVIKNNFGLYGSAIHLSGTVSGSSSTIISLTGSIKNTEIINNNSISSYGALRIEGYSEASSLPSIDLTMEDCKVNNNIVINGYTAGIYMVIGYDKPRGPKLTMTNCEITGNSGSYSNSSYTGRMGFYYGHKTELYISGRIVIKDNVLYDTYYKKYYNSDLYIAASKGVYPPIYITGALTEDSLIGVTKYRDLSGSNPVYGTGVVTSGLSGNATLDNFFSSKNEFYTSLDNGEVVLNEKVKVIYNRNNINTGAVPDTGYYIANVEKAVIADGGTLSKNGFTFVGWNTAADGTGTLYKPGDTFDISSDITLYAIFEHGSHDDADFVQWTDELAAEQNGAGKTATNSLPSVAGDYFISKDVTLTSTWNVPSGTTNLCLSGHGIKLNGSGSVIFVDDGAKLNIHDCDNTIRHYYVYPSTYYGKATNFHDEYVSGLSYQTSLDGGYITGGTGALVGSDTCGGGIMINTGGEVSLLGGCIIGNSANIGGGVYVASGAKFTMSGNASIRYNETVTTGNGHTGGGVYLAGEFVMTGGYVSSNYAIANRGGGVMIDNGTFTMSSGYVSSNASKGNLGAGICVSGDSAILIISGNANITSNKDASNTNNSTNKSNIYLENNKKISVVGELTGYNSSIGVSMNTPGVFTNTDEENLQYHKETIFFSDSTSNSITKENGQLVLIPSGAVASITKDGSTQYYTNISTALSNWVDGSTLKLLADISGTQITVSSGTKTLDLNNHSITYTSGSIIVVSGGNFTLQDTSTNKTKHYYNINKTGLATISTSVTDYYFEGGYITGGVATDSRGGGLKITGGNVNFTSGTIFACKAGWGGGIHTKGTFSLNISDSAAIIGCYSSGSYTSGGGIFCEGTGNITMTGGSIRHNSSQFSGGGVRVSLQETTGTHFIMTGGEITGNYSNSKQGSGLGIDMATRIKVGGSARICDNDGDNLFLKNGGYVTVVEPFTEDALIVVVTQTTPTEGNSIVITDQWKTIMGDADYKGTFKWINNNYRISKNSSGELVAAILHTHDWEYSIENNVITATCQNSDDCDVVTATLTLNAVGKDYDGTGVVATVEKSSGWSASEGLPEEYEIVYSGNTNAGTYTASVTISDVTATKSFTISPIKATVTITGHNTTVDYNGTSHNATGYDAEANTTLFDVTKDFTFSGLAEVSRTNAGKSEMGLTSSMFSNTNTNFSEVTFVVTDGYITINQIKATVTITGHNNKVDYNGASQKVTGYDAVVNTTLYDVTKDFTFSGVAEVSRTNAGKSEMGLAASQFTNTNTNFSEVTFVVTDGYITINQIKATVTITGHNSKVDYDSTSHKVTGYDAVANTTLYDATKDFTFSGVAEVSRTNAGTSTMGLTSSQFTNTNTNFSEVTFVVTDGYITINQIKATVTITGHNSKVDYDSTSHKVTGYDAVANTTLYDLTKDFTFSGKAEIARTNAGTTLMGLAASMFTNNNENFSEVTFVVVDGYITINQIKATVTITGHNTTVDYDGTSHKVSGYDEEVNTTLYDLTKDYTFSGKAEIARTNAGTTSMGLTSSQFTNTNENFSEVTFVITDGYIQINQIKATVTITGHNTTVDYDGTSHKVSGYDAEANTTLYDVTKDFTFSGLAEVSRTNAGKSEMGLTSSMFSNTNTNFSEVTFVITDGYIQINQIKATVTITGHNDTLDYDGKSHKVTGFDAVADTDLYDVTKDFDFSGLAEVERTNAGETEMVLTSSMFTNTNPNFSEVTFIVTSGYIKVNQIKAIVKIIGHNVTSNYDGYIHIIDGFDAVADTDLYDVTKDFNFSGKTEIIRTNAGITEMGLKASMFTNTNPNFSEVTFEIYDGYVNIKKINATVTITGNNATVDYDGALHIITGYDAVASTPLYNISNDLRFSGISEINRTNAGTTNMGLNASMFTNISDNFNEVTFVVVDGYITINQIKATVIITGHNDTIDYDGAPHAVTGFDAETDTALYDVTKDLSFTGLAEIARTNSGKTEMGLNAQQFRNTNPNFSEVTFVVTDGYITINQIKATVTITGHNDTTDYDGKLHTVKGYDAESDSALFDVTKDLSFTGSAEAARTNAGTTEMGLNASQFTNTNPNFSEVTFVVVDGYQTVSTVDVIIKVIPQAINVISDGTLLELITKGEVEGGTLYYALVDNADTIPSDNAYSTKLPTGVYPGHYYVWYKVVSDENHNDLAPVQLIAIIGESNWITISGVLYQSDKEIVSGVKVFLKKGNQTIDLAMTNDKGEYSFKVEKGVYNIVSEHETNVDTVLVSAFEDIKQDIIMSESKTESKLEVNTEDEEYAGITVGGLNDESYAIREADGLDSESNISLVMTVEPKTEEEAGNASEIIEIADNKSFEFLDIKVNKTVDSVTTLVSETHNVLEIVVPYEKINRHDIVVYSYHDNNVIEFKEIHEGDSIVAGTYRIDKENSYIHIYTNRFSTFAIGYTPHYTVDTKLSLGSFNGNVNVTLRNISDGKVYTPSNLVDGKVSFTDIPMGEYVMTISWEDGIVNTLEIPMQINGNNSKLIESEDVLDKKDEVDFDEESNQLDNQYDVISEASGDEKNNQLDLVIDSENELDQFNLFSNNQKQIVSKIKVQKGEIEVSQFKEIMKDSFEECAIISNINDKKLSYWKAKPKKPAMPIDILIPSYMTLVI